MLSACRLKLDRGKSTSLSASFGALGRNGGSGRTPLNVNIETEQSHNEEKKREKIQSVYHFPIDGRDFRIFYIIVLAVEICLDLSES